MTGARNVSANSAAVTDRRYRHPERSRGIPLRKLASSHRHPEASEGPHLVREVTQGKLAVREPYVRSLSPSRTGVVFAVRDDERVRTGPLFRESSFV